MHRFQLITGVAAAFGIAITLAGCSAASRSTADSSDAAASSGAAGRGAAVSVPGSAGSAGSVAGPAGSADGSAGSVAGSAGSADGSAGSSVAASSSHAASAVAVAGSSSSAASAVAANNRRQPGGPPNATIITTQVGGSASLPIGLATLTPLLSSLPADISTAILGNPSDFESMLAAAVVEPASLTILVDKEHPLPENYAPPDIVNLRDYNFSLNRSDLQLSKIAIPDLEAMVHAAREVNVPLLLSSTYRSYAVQKAVFAREVEQYGLAQAERESAHPGTSQHQLGTAIDFGSITEAFADTAAGKWLDENAWKYGFVISYPNGYEKLTGYMYEPWHFRYIGRPAAALCEKYFDGIQQYLLVFMHDLPAAVAARLAGTRT